MNKSKKLYIYATVMIVSFLFAVIAFTTIVLKNIVSFNSYESSSIYEIETTCTTSETLSTSYSTSTHTLTTSTYTQTSSTATETSKVHTSSETATVTTLTDKDQIIAITNYQIIVIPDETTVNTKAITSTTTTKIETTACATTTTQAVIGNEDVRSSANFVKTFTRGTYYPGWEGYGSTQVYGGSGRLLMDCSIKDDEIKGSVACKYVYEKYGYNYNGVRTIVYLDIPEMPELSGFYFLDDCCGRYDTIDFYFTYKANCPFKDQGVLNTITCYIVPNGGND